jgi:hemin uptake protein HemP
MDQAPTDHAAHQSELTPPRGAFADLPAIPSSKLLGGQAYVLIEHGGAIYWLRATRSGKLILTK